MSDEKNKQIASSVVLAQHGNKNAYRDIYITFYKKIFFICSAMTGDNAGAIDLTSEIFIKMFESVEKLDDHMAFEEWFYAFAVNICRNYMSEADDSVIGDKIPQIAREASKAAVAHDKFTFEHDIIKILEEMILCLPAEARVIFFYRYFANMSSERIAALEKSEDAQEAEAKVHAVDVLLNKQVELIREYGIDISMFTADMNNTLLHIASKMFVPDSVHSDVSKAVGIDVNPFAAAKKKEQSADNSIHKPVKQDEKQVKKNILTKSDAILFFAVLAVALIVFSGIKLYKKTDSGKNSSTAAADIKQNSSVAKIWNGAASTSFAGGNGTLQSPFLIENAAQLAFLANLVNDGNSQYASCHYRLTNDIVLNDVSDFSSWETSQPENTWTPIGSSAEDKIGFSGVFDGNDHTIKGMYINSEDSAGLFGCIRGGTVKNLLICYSYVKSEKNAGGVTAEFYIDSDVDASCIYCGFSGIVKSFDGNAGGIAGTVLSDRENHIASFDYCYSSGKVSSENGACGGIVGKGDSANGNIKISESFNSAFVYSAKEIAGGIVGELISNGANVLVGNCLNYGKVISANNGVSGGIAGFISSRSVTGRINISQCAMLNSSSKTDLTKGDGGERLVVTDVNVFTESEMADKENHPNLNFEEIWMIDADCYDFPVLIGLTFVPVDINEESSSELL